MTFLQRRLGTNYKWWYILKFAFKSNTAYRGNSIMWLLSSITTTLGLIFVWYTNYFQANNLNEFPNIFTYFVIGEAFIFSTAIQYDIGENILDGKITSKLLRPTNIFGFYTVNAFGYQLFENLARIIIYSTISIILYKYIIFAGSSSLIYFLIASIIALILNFLFGIITGLSAFWLTAYFGSAQFLYDIKVIFSGRFFPLNLLPIGFSNILNLPFAYTFFHPTQIYLGKYNNTQIIQTYVGGIIWCIILWILARLVFKAGLKKNEAVGL